VERSSWSAPATKTALRTRRAFSAKCASYLQQGIDWLLSIIVTSRLANLHNDLIQLLEVGDDYLVAPESTLCDVIPSVRRPAGEADRIWANTLPLARPYPSCRYRLIRVSLCRLIGGNLHGCLPAERIAVTRKIARTSPRQNLPPNCHYRNSLPLHGELSRIFETVLNEMLPSR